MRIGILFGGAARERDHSLAKVRALYTILDRSLFGPVLLFVDAYGQLARVDWAAVQHDRVRDLLKLDQQLPDSPNGFEPQQESLGPQGAEQPSAILKTIGQPLPWEALPKYIDFAWIALAESAVQTGEPQRRLQALELPYSGLSGNTALPDADWLRQLQAQRVPTPPFMFVEQQDWHKGGAEAYYVQIREKVGLPVWVQAAHQTRSAGRTLIGEEAGLEGFELAMNRAFFRELLPLVEWKDRSAYERIEYLRMLGDLEDGLGFPIAVSGAAPESQIFFHPEQLLRYLDEAISAQHLSTVLVLESQLKGDDPLIVQHRPLGKAFACSVFEQPDGQPLALLPQTLPSRKPALRGSSLTETEQQQVRSACREAFDALGAAPFVQFKGYLSEKGEVLIAQLSSQLDHHVFAQMAVLGLSPTAALTAFIYAALQAGANHPEAAAVWAETLKRLDDSLAESSQRKPKRVALLMGGHSSMQEVSMDSGRHIFQWLSSAKAYSPEPYFYAQGQLFPLPMNALLAQSAAALHQQVPCAPPMEAEQLLKAEGRSTLLAFGSSAPVASTEAVPLGNLKQSADFVFIALHGSDGENGELQKQLRELGLPYNGADAEQLQHCMDKYKTVQTLKRNGISVPMQLRLTKADYEQKPEESLQRIESQLNYPFIAKPLDEAGSHGVKLLRSRAELEAYTRMLFRPQGEEGREARRVLDLKGQAPFPRKEAALFEEQIVAKGGGRFMEINGTLLGRASADGTPSFEWIGLSAMRPAGEVLSLDEKYLRAQAHSSTPPVLSLDERVQPVLLQVVKTKLERVARTLNLKGLVSIDAFAKVDSEQQAEVVVLEVNALPALGRGAIVCQQAAANGREPSDWMAAMLAEPTAVPVPASAAAPPAEPLPSNSYVPPVIASDKPRPDPIADNQPPRSAFQPKSTGEYLKERALYLLKEVWYFLKSPIFLRNFIGIMAMLTAAFLVTKWSLNWYTRHGESIQVPDYVGMDMRDAARKAEKQNFKLVAIDSFFDSSKRPNTIYQQEPKPMQRAKEGRTIYVSKYRAQADSVLLPSLVSAGYNYDQYTLKLRRLDVKASIKERVFDSKQEENSILHFYFNGRKITDELLRRGVKVPKGSSLEFVITERITNQVPLPDLICKRYDEASFLLSSSSLVLGRVIGGTGNESSAYIYKQEPEYLPGQMIEKGSSISIYLTLTRPDGCPESTDFNEGDDDPFEGNNDDF